MYPYLSDRTTYPKWYLHNGSRKMPWSNKVEPRKISKIETWILFGEKIYYFIYIAMNLYCFCVIASLNICRQHAFLHGSTKMDLTQQSFCIVYFRNLLFPPLLILQHKRENTFQSNNQNFAACRGQVLFKCAPWSEKKYPQGI